MNPSRHSRAYPPLLERLEDRLLLSASLASQAQAGEIVSMDWQGKQVQARAGEWVVRLSGTAAPDQLYTSLVNSGLAGSSMQSLGLAGFSLLRGDQRDFSVVSQWAAGRSDVLYVEPNFVYHAADFTEQAIPDDTSFGSLWGLNNTGQSGGTVDADIDAPEAWNITTGSSSVVITIIDTGMDYTHPDLAANVWHNPGEIAEDGIDNDGNGYVDDVYGWDFAYGDSDPTDGDGHGTHVAGTIGAVGDNNKGVVGVNWSIKMMPLKFLDDSGTGSTDAAIQAINYATMMKRDHGINIVATNNSWGGGGYSSALRDAIAAGGDQGIIFVAAAGNGGNDGIGDNNDITPHYPSNYDLDCIISVAATDRNDQRASFSNYGATAVDLAAPGVSILSTLPGNNYGSYSGTSMAAPHVAGAVGLLAAAMPSATRQEIKLAILSGTDSIAAMGGKSVSGGRLNAYAALLAVAQAGPGVVSVSPPATSPPTDVVNVTFTEDILPASVVATNFSLQDNGADNAFGTTDDHVISISASNLSQPQPNVVRITLGSDLPLEQYRLTVTGTGANPIRDLEDNPLNEGADYVHNFQITSAGPLEPNDSLAQAFETGLTGPGLVSYSATIGDGFHGAADVDLYAIEVGASATITLDIDAATLASPLDSILRLFDASGHELAFNDDDLFSLDSYIQYTTTFTGRYHVGVSGYSNSYYDPLSPGSGIAGSAGAYELYITVAGGGGGGNDVVLAGTDMTLGVNGDGSLVTSGAYPIGAILLGQEFLAPGVPQASFSLAAGGNVYQNNSPAAGSDIAMVTTDASGGSTLRARSVGSVGGIGIVREIAFGSADRHATFTVTLTNSTATTINNVAWLENLDGDQGYYLALSFMTSNDVLYGGRYAEASFSDYLFPQGLTLAVGSSDPRAVASTEGFDLVNPFDVINSPQDAQGIAGDICLNLAFDLGNLSAAGSVSFTYYLILDTSIAAARSRYESLTGGGDEMEPNDTLATATASGLSAGMPGSMTFSATLGDGTQGTRDVDLYVFQAVEGDVITADIDAGVLGSSFDSYLRLFNAAGVELAGNDDADGLDSLITRTLSAGEYYVGVSGYNNDAYNPDVAGSGVAGSTGDYGLTLTLAGGAHAPDAYGYAPSSVSPSFEDISSTGALLLAPGADDEYAPIPSAGLTGFDFQFYGASYNSLHASSNGLLTFGQGDSTYGNTNLSTAPTTPTIAAFWDDLVVKTSDGVYWQLRGSGGQQRLIVQWNNVNFFNGGGSITFQAVLYEADDSIVLNYQDLNAGTADDGGASATVGIKDAGAQPAGTRLLTLCVNGGPNQFVGTGLSTRIAVLLGDADGNRTVDLADLGILATNYTQSGVNWRQGDFDRNGIVDLSDLGILATNWGQHAAGLDAASTSADAKPSATAEAQLLANEVIPAKPALPDSSLPPLQPPTTDLATGPKPPGLAWASAGRAKPDRLADQVATIRGQTPSSTGLLLDLLAETALRLAPGPTL